MVVAAGAGGTGWRQVLLGLLVSLVALAAVLCILDLHQVGVAFARSQPAYLLAALPILVTSLLCRAQAWRTLLEGAAPLRSTFAALNQGYLVNNLLPLRLGDLASSYLLGRRVGLPPLHVLSTVALERVLDLAFALSLLVGSAFAVWRGTTPRLPVAITASGLAVTLLAVPLVARHRARLIALARSPRGPARAARLKLADALSGLGVLDHPGRVALASGWLAASWLQVVALLWLCLRAFVPQPSLLHVAFGLAVSSLGIALPSSPGGVGVVEAAWTGALALCGVDRDAAFAFAVTSHVLTVVVTVVLGGWALARQGQSLFGLYSDVRRVLPSLRRTWS